MEISIFHNVGEFIGMFLCTFVLKTLCRPQCNARQNEGFMDHETPKFCVGICKAVEICLHPSHPSVEWIEVFLWSYEIYQALLEQC